MKPIKNIEKISKLEKQYLKKKFGVTAFKDLSTAILKSLKEAMKDLTDSRVKEKCQYKIWDVVVCVTIASLCGCKDWDEIHDFVDYEYDFFRSFLKMTGGIPSAKTYERIMSIINHKELENILTTFFLSITNNLFNSTDIINLDGRENKGSKRNETIKSDKINSLSMLNVYSNNYQMCLASEIIDEKSNEIPTVEAILPTLKIDGAIVTWDALNTQKSNVTAVINCHANYVVPIKGNHPIFYKELIDFFDQKQQEYIRAGKPKTAYKKNCEYHNGKAIMYEYFQTEEVNWFEDKQNWTNLHSFCMVKKTITDNDKTSTECRYYISNLFLDIDIIAKAIKEHWAIENKLHWHLDFTFQLDKNNTLNKNALANLEIINKFCLAMLKRVQHYYNKSLKRIIHCLGLDIEYNFLEFIAFLTLAKSN